MEKSLIPPYYLAVELSLLFNLESSIDWEICISKSSGIAGWVFEHRQSAIVSNAYNDSRFYDGVDEMTCFCTRNLICAPLIDHREYCLGTLQSLNKKSGEFTTEDIKLLGLTARLVTVAIKNSRLFNEIKTTNNVRGKVIIYPFEGISDLKSM